MGEVRLCDECEWPYRTSWRDPGICMSCAGDNLKRAVREEIVIPVLEWIKGKLCDSGGKGR